MKGRLDHILACLFIAASLAPQIGAGQASAEDGIGTGEELFATYCSGCHNDMGIGVPGLAPPLDRPDFWQTLDQGASRYIGGVVSKGFNMPITVRGERYAGMFMSPMAGLSDEELARISTWVLQTLGETDVLVSADTIAEIRASGLKNADLKAMRPKTQ